MTADARVGEEIIRRHSKSFSLASRLLPGAAQGHAVAVYAWCRRADDAIDLVEAEVRPAALATLSDELQEVYTGATLDDPVLALFQRTVRDRGIPIEYARDLLTGMEMDVREQRYETMAELLEYCYYVAGCVGLMMCHVMGVRDDDALRNATHMGMAMQLTNICRDVEEDWGRDRLYIPDSLLARCGAAGLADRLGSPFPEEARAPMAKAISELLDEADRYYASGDEGLHALSPRCALAIRTARRVYSSIGGHIRAAGCDPLAGRAYVPGAQKLALVLGSLAATASELPARLLAARGSAVFAPTRLISFPEDVLPL